MNVTDSKPLPRWPLLQYAGVSMEVASINAWQPEWNTALFVSILG